jgi:hypothetical protein
LNPPPNDAVRQRKTCLTTPALPVVARIADSVAKLHELERFAPTPVARQIEQLKGL